VITIFVPKELRGTHSRKVYSNAKLQTDIKNIDIDFEHLIENFYGYKIDEKWILDGVVCYCSPPTVVPAVVVTLVSEVGAALVLVVILVNNGIPLSHLHAVSSLSPFGCMSLIPAAITPFSGASIPVELVWKINILNPLPPPRGASVGLLNCIIS
jgi:hypothetical protein